MLGPIEVERDGQPRPVNSPKQRLLLAILTAARGPVSRGRLIEGLWADEPPASAASTLMGYVSRLRGALDAHAVESHPDGYMLRADRIDADQFQALIDSPGEGVGDPGRREAALALWRGEAFGEFSGHPFLVGEVRRLRELRNHTRIRLAGDVLEAGDPGRAIAVLEALLADEPSREDAWVLLVEAMVAAGRSADAVRAAQRCRRELAEIGLEPSPSLTAAEGSALGHGTATAQPDADPPELVPLRYARNGGVHLAYQVTGGGPVDVVLSSYGSASIDSVWDSPPFSAFVDRIAQRCRVVLYDTRGIGLSDPINVDSPPSLEDQSDDLLSVLHAAGTTRAVVVGVGDGGPTAITFAHRHSGSLAGLVLVNTFARLIASEDYPGGISREQFNMAVMQSTDPASDRDAGLVLRNHAPSVSSDRDFRRWWDRAGRRGASPATAAAVWRVRYGADVRALLPTIAVPTLVVHRSRTRIVPVRHGRFLADHIPGARFIEVDGADQTPFTDGGDKVADSIIEFATSLAT